MHIEPGYISAAKIALANTAAIGLLGSQATALVRKPQLIVRTLLAAVFFTLFMQVMHVQIGPSELHFVGAMPIYLTLGFVPTLLGFGIGLLLQGLVFTPTDLVHLGVNTLSLAVPLSLLHLSVGHKLREVNIKTILKLDAIYYSGVTLMVGFWLSISEVATPLSAWAAFAASYALIVACEPLVTWLAVRNLQRFEKTPLVRFCFELPAKAA